MGLWNYQEIGVNHNRVISKQMWNFFGIIVETTAIRKWRILESYVVVVWNMADTATRQSMNRLPKKIRRYVLEWCIGLVSSMYFELFQTVLNTQDKAQWRLGNIHLSTSKGNEQVQKNIIITTARISPLRFCH